MATINFTVEDHSIRVDNLIELAQGSNNFDTCAFSFDSTWDGFTLYAVMYQNPKNVFKLPLDAENTRKIPQEVLQKDGWVYIGGRGEKEDTDETIATSMVVRLPVRKGAVNGNETGQEMLDQSQYEYLLGKVNELNEKCESLTKELENDISQLSEDIDDLKENGTGTGGTVTAEYIDYDLNVKAINHRGYNGTAPENTIPAFILSKQKGYKYVEADVAFTSDGVAVLLHDSTIDRTSNGTGSISALTYNEVLAYDFGSWKSSDYAGVKIPTFTEFVMTCKGIGLHPYIELKSSGGYTQEQIAGIVDAVKAAGMEGKVTYISFNATFLGYVKAADSKARLGYLVDYITDTAISTATALKTGENEVFMDAGYNTATAENVALCVENDLPLEIWTVNSQSVIESMDGYVTGVTSDNLIAGKILYDKYMTYTAPESEAVPATGITLDQTTLTFDDATTQTLVATLEPTYTTDTVVWSSDDEDVATVSNGVVTPIAKGSCTITATAGSVSATCAVTVNVEEIVTYTITRSLTGCSSSSAITSVNERTEHTETITANSGYTLDGATVTIIMGGSDISSNYADGVLTITSVTGNIVISVSAVAESSGGGETTGTLLHSWDFTQGLTDSVGGTTAVLGGNATQDLEGVHLTDATSYCLLGSFLEDKTDEKIIEVDIASTDGNVGSSHGRLVTLNYNSDANMMYGLIYRNTGAWNVYTNGGWGTDTEYTNINEFGGKTLKLKISNTEFKVYANGVLVYEGASGSGGWSNLKYCQLGSSSSSFYNAVISAVRVYDVA